MKTWSIGAAAAAVCALCGESALAGIASYTGNVSIIDAPLSIRPGRLESDHNVFAFAEASGYMLDHALAVDIMLPGFYDNSVQLSHGFIDAGTEISSFYVHQDLVGKKKGKSRISEFSIAFDAPILGIMIAGDGRGVNGSTLDDSDFLNPNTLYAYNLLGRSRGTLDSIHDLCDHIELSEDGMTITVQWRSTARKMDGLRIITEGSVVPAPGALALLGLAGVVGFGRRRRG